jgi:hypothetical protein
LIVGAIVSVDFIEVSFPNNGLGIWPIGVSNPGLKKYAHENRRELAFAGSGLGVTLCIVDFKYPAVQDCIKSPRFTTHPSSI